MVPVVDLLGQSVLDGRQRLGDQFLLAATDLAQVDRDQVNGRVLKGLAFQARADPVGQRMRSEGLALGFRQRTVIQERGVVSAFDLALAGDFDELEPLRNGTTVSRPVSPGVLNRVLQVEQGSNVVALIVVVCKNGPSLEKVVVVFEDEVKGRPEPSAP